MKRLSLADFGPLWGYSYPITEETPWGKIGASNRDEINLLYDHEDICALMGVESEYQMGWFNNNILNKRPAGIVLDKVNRAMEQLGMIDE